MSFKIKSQCLNCNCEFETIEPPSFEGEVPPCPACGSFDVLSHHPGGEAHVEIVRFEDMLDDVYER